MTARALTAGEWSALSPGLEAALGARNVTPQIEDRPHFAAHLARWRYRRVPILALGSTIWWPNARADFSGAKQMAVLQHELQHVLDFAEGRLTAFGYLTRPSNWTYRWKLAETLDWSRLGAEQRASVAEALWRAERSGDHAAVERLRNVIPWARPRRD
ncbi:MAG TPA: hypothetical protein VHS81_09685 [Caulobacteraceae bacterium]|jgi:hypothetical protein|nr:hypothetical protein [Caulobacteraceae bacterium]